MKRIDVGQLISIMANIGVIAGIAFLAFELQQNNELLAAQARADRRDIARDASRRHLDYPELRLARRKALDGETFTQDDSDLLEFAYLSVLTDWQYIYLETLRGALAEDAINVAGWDLYLSEYAGLREYWKANTHRYDPAFVRWMAENIE